jgi:hypothetical protein
LDGYFGGKRCVVRGDPVNSEWHHLDDDTSNERYANFIPIGSEMNLALRDARGASTRGETPTLRFGELTPSALLAQAVV